MMEGIATVKKILLASNVLLKRQTEIKRLKGENFNIFSILGMETKENKTHSAFLGELLNPSGTHLMGSIFLELFLKELGIEKSFNAQGAKLTLELHLGKRDDKAKVGGRVDIYLKDVNGNSICLENKIYAIDQNAQLERYANHNKSKNTVIYLTLNGSDATNKSRGNLVDGKEYFNISYRDTIVNWLNNCAKESSEQPILRESIRQYTLLIKKLTNQLNDKLMEKEFELLFEQYYEAATLIQDNLWKVELKKAEELLTEIQDVVSKELGDEWSFSPRESLNKNYTGLWLQHSSWKEVWIAIEGQNKIPWGSAAFGIWVNIEKTKLSKVQDVIGDNIEFLAYDFKVSKWWTHQKILFSLNSVRLRKRLFNEEEFDKLVKFASKSMIDLAIESKDILSKVS